MSTCVENEKEGTVGENDRTSVADEVHEHCPKPGLFLYALRIYAGGERQQTEIHHEQADDPAKRSEARKIAKELSAEALSPNWEARHKAAIGVFLGARMVMMLQMLHAVFRESIPDQRRSDAPEKGV